MSTNTKVNVDVISVNTKKTQNEFKSLKTKIKELRLELENLDEGTAEYQAKITELGNLMHQNAEIQEQAKLATQDYGSTLQSVTKATTGLVASISAVNGVMNLMGVNSDEATKAMLKVQSLMAIVQGLSALDESEKAFQSLWVKIKNATSARKENAEETIKDTVSTTSNTNAVNNNAEAFENQSKSIKSGTSGLKLFGSGIKNLGRSLKSFALSNPFTLIITSITTAISLVSNFIEKTKQARIEAQNALNENLNQLQQNNANDTQQNTFYNKSNAEAYYNELKKLGDKQNELQGNQERLNKTLYESAQIDIAYQQALITLKQKELDREQQRLDLYTEEQKQVEPFLTEYQNYLKDRISLYQQQFDLEVKTIQTMKGYLSTLKEGSDEYANTLNDIAEAEKRLANIVESDIKNSFTNIDSLDKQRQALLDKEDEEAKQKRDKRQQEQYNKVKEWLDLEQKQLEISFTKRKITERDYYEKSINLYEQYNNKLNNIKSNPNVSKVDRLSAEGSILDAKKKLAEYELSLIKQRAILAEQTDILVIDEQKKLQHDIEHYKQLMLENSNKIKELQNKHWLERYIILQQQNSLTEEEQINHLDKMLITEENYLNEQEHVLNSNYNRDKNISEETYQRDIDVLKFQLDKLLITQEQYDYELSQLEIQHKNELLNIENEYNLQLIDIQAQRNQIELDYSNQRYEIARNEAERKISLNETYFNSFQNIQSQLSSFLSEYQNSMDSNSEKYKELQRLQIIMDSASGSYSAFVSAFKSGIPFPYNLVMGGIASGLVVGQGVLALNNLNSNKIGTTNAVNNLGNTSTYETLSYETMNGIENSIRNSKVYVLESDISNVANRVNVVEMESRF